MMRLNCQSLENSLTEGCSSIQYPNPKAISSHALKLINKFSNPAPTRKDQGAHGTGLKRQMPIILGWRSGGYRLKNPIPPVET